MRRGMRGSSATSASKIIARIRSAEPRDIIVTVLMCFPSPRILATDFSKVYAQLTGILGCTTQPKQ